MDSTFYMAPMLGITDACFRTTYMEVIGGFHYAISPFIRTLKGERYKVSKFKDLNPHANGMVTTFPQILSNQASDFVKLAKDLFDLGYPIVNLNMGCPVPTAAGRGRGAGLLPEIDYVDDFLNEIHKQIPGKVSIKTRLGLESDKDLLRMVEVFNRYPLYEVIIHPRTAKQKYSGQINHQLFIEACSEMDHQVVYSGDLFTVEDYLMAKKKHPYISKWMFGRGILYDPMLISKIRGTNSKDKRLVSVFYQELAKRYHHKGFSDHIILSRLKVLLTYFFQLENIDRKSFKLIRKSKSTKDLFALLQPTIEDTVS